MNVVKLSQKKCKNQGQNKQIAVALIWRSIIGSVCGSGSPRSLLQASVAGQH